MKVTIKTAQEIEKMRIAGRLASEVLDYITPFVKPGVTTRWHRLLGTVERYCIMSGRGLVEVGELPPQSVVAGDVVLIPPSCRQRITNVGMDDLIFLAICSPRFVDSAYEDIEAGPN